MKNDLRNKKCLRLQTFFICVATKSAAQKSYHVVNFGFEVGDFCMGVVQICLWSFQRDGVDIRKSVNQNRNFLFCVRKNLWFVDESQTRNLILKNRNRFSGKEFWHVTSEERMCELRLFDHNFIFDGQAIHSIIRLLCKFELIINLFMICTCCEFVPPSLICSSFTIKNMIIN